MIELTQVELVVLILATVACGAFVFSLGWLVAGQVYEAEEEEPRLVETRKRRNTSQALDQADPPSRDQLNKLKEILRIANGNGSLQFKKRGAGVYQVLYDNGRYRWKHLGSWGTLKQRIEESN